jgi:type II secretory ATPase GspE/PulE/Tfp pilus assembly ATPase PilB-like protein
MEAGILDPEAMATTILTDAIAKEVKHVWVEPQQNYLRVRIRVGENTIHELMRLPKDQTIPLVAQFKKLAGLNVLVNDVPQRGYLAFTSNHAEHQFWTMSLPTRFGEKIVVWIVSAEGLMPELRQATHF